MKNLILFIFLIYFSAGFYLYIDQRNFIYFPVASINNTFKERVFENDGHKIKASIINSGRGKAIIYFGGNAENVDNNALSFTQLFTDHTVYLVKYRGYGGSSGEPTETGIYSDALHIYDRVSQNHETVSVIGRSLGSGVATYVASKKSVDKLVLITPFDSVQSVAQARFPIYPMSVLLKDKHDSLSRVKDIHASTLVIAAARDSVIPSGHTEQLVDGFTKDIMYKVIEGVGHNDISSAPSYSRLLQGFLSPESLNDN